jgi:antitoxin FitA
MGAITIRQLDDSLKARLRIRAARHNRSMEAEARKILADALVSEPEKPENLADLIRRHFAPFGGVTLKLPKRGPMRPAPKFR